MFNTLEIQKFIREHFDWEQLLTQKPYCIGVQKDRMLGRNLILLKYSQIDSDFNLPLVRECRGLILDRDTLEPVCVPFFKFGNYGESYCPEINWTDCHTEAKIDGSLIKVVRMGDELLVSTNGTIDAFKAPIQDQLGFVGKTFGDLFVMGLREAIDARNDDDALVIFKSLLKEGYTYMFELTSPYNKVVVTWHETKLWFLGVRNNETMEETFYGDHELSNFFSTPKVYPLSSLDECVKAAEELGTNEEGFVVCDDKFNRVKVKNPVYVALHHMKNNGALSFERGIDIIRKGELDEVLTYFPEFSEHLSKIQDDIDILREKLSNAWLKFKCVKYLLPTRKDQALTITSKDCFGKYSGVGFALLDGKISSVDEWIDTVPSKNLVKFLGYKEDAK